MDWYFTLFVIVVALTAAGGISLSLVGYFILMPASLSYGKTWLRWVATIPVSVLAIPLFLDALLLLFGAGIQLLTVLRWAGIPALAIHFLALVWFVFRHWEACRRPGIQFGVGAILILSASMLLYGAGPYFAGRLLAGLK